MKSRLSAADVTIIRQLSMDSRTLATVAEELKSYSYSCNHLKSLYSKPNKKIYDTLSVVGITPKECVKCPVSITISHEDWAKNWLLNQEKHVKSINRNGNGGVLMQDDCNHIELCCSDNVLEALDIVLKSHSIKVDVKIETVKL
jgi:hypothetical protein